MTAWLPRLRPSPAARLLLYCFPHAGGGASAFASWPARLPAEVEVRAVQYPGREGRFREPLVTRMDDLAAGAVAALRPTIDRPFALLGHSLGASAAYAVALELARSGLEPVRLLASAHRAPHLPPRATLSDLPSADLRRALHELNGTTSAILENDELMEVLEPALRADFEVDETYRPDPAARLACPITVFGGEQDLSVSDAELHAWAERTTSTCARVRLAGDHFSVLAGDLLPREVSAVLARFHRTGPAPAPPL